jgi:hypothetical protein
MNETVTKEIPKILFAFVLGLAGSALGVGLLSWRDIALTGQSVGELERRVGAVETAVQSIGVENTTNSLARVDHKYLLGKLQETIDRIRDDVSALKTKAGARTDPFTGTEGRVLEKRIDRLEEQRDER